MTRTPSAAQALEQRGRLSLSTPTPPASQKRDDWRQVEESGSTFAIRSLIVAATMFGRPFARGIVNLVALYYTLVSSRARRSVADFRRHLGLGHSVWHAYRHIRSFAQCSLDALFFMRGKTDGMHITHDGHGHLQKLRASKNGGILIGAHLGSFYAMRQSSNEAALPLHPIVYTKNAKKFNAVLESLDPTSTTRLIEIGEGGQVAFMLKIRDRLDAGAIVAILADRVQKGSKTVEVEFLGSTIRLPAGPYILAASLRRPVYFTAGIYRGANRYDLHCVPFADTIVLPRGQRMEAVQRYAQQYADLLADFCRRYPENWFNFFDYFDEPSPQNDKSTTA